MSNETLENDGIDIGKKHKLGHLRIDPQGNTTFKHLPTNQLVESLQLGIQYSVGGLEARAAPDVLFHDFLTVEIIDFPKSGNPPPKPTPPHRFSDFTLRSYAPVAFRHFREKFNIRPEDYLSSLNKPFRELKNPGASGSLFYLTADDEFIIKTVQKKEAEFLKTLLPGYYMNIMQNQRTLLPKFFGLYCYQVTELLSRTMPGVGDNKNIRITVMNNLIPSYVPMHERYDLKGSTFKRRASEEERQKEFPTWKDLDFLERHPDGLILDADTYNALKKTVERDCRVLQSFHIMDYSFLIGVHQVDTIIESSGDFTTSFDATSPKPKRMIYSTPMDTIQATFDEFNKPDDHLAKTGGIPARTANGQRLALYVGIIDILQSYALRKKIEHRLKVVMTNGAEISVTNPNTYSERFQKFLFSTVFKRAPQRASKIAATDSSSYTALSAWTERGFGPPYARAMLSNNSPSTTTTSSHITSNYASGRSSIHSDVPRINTSSTTLHDSSQQSDSLYNEPTTRRSQSRIVTTSFSKDKRYPHRDSSIPAPKSSNHLHPKQADNHRRKKLASSTKDLSSGTFAFDPNQRKHRSTNKTPDDDPSLIEVTRF